MFKKRLAQNFGANLFAQFANVLLQLASVPLFLSFWSKDRYGAWLLLSAIPAYLSLGDAGFALSSANEVSMAVAEGNRVRALRSLHTAWGFLCGVSIVLTALAVGAFYAVPWNQWLRFANVAPREVQWTIFLFSLYTIGGILIGAFGIIYRAVYRFARFNVLSTSGSLAQFVATAIALALTRSMICIAGVMLLTRLLLLWVYVVDSRKVSPDLKLGLAGFSFDELRRSWRPSVMFMANTLGNALYIQGLTLLVGASLGAAAVVTFNTTRTLTRVIVQFDIMIRQSVWPEFSYLFGSGDMERARALNKLIFEISAAASVALAAVIFLAAPWIIPVWTHHAVHANSLLVAILLSSAMLNGLWSVTSGLLMGTNQHEGLTFRYLIAASVAIIAGTGTVQFLGLDGIALSMVLCEVILVPYTILKNCDLMRQPVKEFLLDAMQLRAIREVTGVYCNRWLVKVG